MFNQYYQGKKVFITGNTGFKGSWLSLWLLKLGAKVTGYSIDVPSNPALFSAADLSRKLNHHTGDVCHFEPLLQAIQEAQPDIVFHMAAQPLVRLSYDAPLETFNTNLQGTVHVLEAVRRVPSVKAAVIVTTDKVYKNYEWEFGYRENDELGGKDPYSASKACAELAAQAYSQSFFNNPLSTKIVTARAGNVIGGGDWSLDRILPDCVRAWSQKKPVTLRSLESTRPWQHVLEPLAGYLLLAQKAGLDTKGEFLHQAYNFGPSAQGQQTVGELIQEFQKTWTECTWNLDTKQTGMKKEAGFLKISSDKAFQSLKWQGILTFEESVAMTAQWYQNYYRNPEIALSQTIDQIENYERQARDRKAIWAV